MYISSSLMSNFPTRFCVSSVLWFTKTYWLVEIFLSKKNYLRDIMHAIFIFSVLGERDLPTWYDTVESHELQILTHANRTKHTRFTCPFWKPTHHHIHVSHPSLPSEPRLPWRQGCIQFCPCSELTFDPILFESLHLRGVRVYSHLYWRDSDHKNNAD